MKTNNSNQSKLKCISVSDLSELIDTNPELHEFVPYRGRFGCEKRESRESWMFCLGLILRRTDTKLGRCSRLLLAMNFDGNVSYRKNGSGLDHKLQNIIIVQLTLKKVFFHLLLCYLCEKKRRILFQFFFFYNL